MRAWTVAVAVLCLAIASSGCLGSGGGLFGQSGPRDYVSSENYTKWVIEVDTIQGQGPPSGALDFLKSRLASVVNKPGGLDLLQDDTMPARGGEWTDRDIAQYVDAHRGTNTGGNTVVTHLLFLDGHSEHDEDNARVLGVAYGHETIVLFAESIASSCTILATNPCTNAAPVWRSVLVHEFGHTMGLVDNGIPMVTPHEDSSHPGHSSSQSSVMYWAVERSGLLSVFTGDPPNDYDAADRADLCRAGGKC